MLIRRVPTVVKRIMVDLGSYKDKFGDSGQRILEHALDESRRRDQNFVSVEHILQALTVEEPDMFNSAMRELSLDPVVVKMAIEKRLSNSRQQHVGKGFRIGPDTTDLFKRAMERARLQGRKTIEATDIFEALSNHDSLFVDEQTIVIAQRFKDVCCFNRLAALQSRSLHCAFKQVSRIRADAKSLSDMLLPAVAEAFLNRHFHHDRVKR